MKTATPEMTEHLQQETTTLTVCWRLTRNDGTRYHFTALDRDLLIDLDADTGSDEGPQTYSALGSFTRTAISNSDDLAVDNLDVFGALGTQVDALELERGLFNNALIEIFLVNWADLSMGIVKLRRGWIGEVISTPEGIFKAEMRGMSQALIRKVGRVITPECDADLGDVRCGVPIFPNVVERTHAYTVGQYVRGPDGGEPLYICTTAGTTAGSAPTYDDDIGNFTTDGTAHFQNVNAWSLFRSVEQVGLIPRKQFYLDLWPAALDESVASPHAPGRGYWPTDSMNNGVVTWITGDNAGLSMEIREFTAGTGAKPYGEGIGPALIELYLPMPFNIQEGDEFRVYRGCMKRLLADCRDVFDNVINFRGFPAIPGSDYLSYYPPPK